MDSKRKMIKATGVVAILFGVFAAIGGFFMVAFSWMIARHPISYWNGWTWVRDYEINAGIMVFLIIFGLLILAAGIAQVILGSRVGKRASDPEIPVSECNGALIAIAVLAFLAVGGLILGILAIVAVCMQSNEQYAVNGQQQMAPQNNRYQQNVQVPGKTVATNNAVNNLVATLERFKQYKADGVITEAQYKQKVQEAVEKNLLSEDSE